MTRFPLLPQAIIICLLLFVSNAFSEVLLIKDGQPQAEIITAENPSRMAQFAAKELQAYLEKISGAKLPILTHPGSAEVKVYVGASPYTATLGVKVDDLVDGAFRMASGPDWLALAGSEKDFVPIEPWGRDRSDKERELRNKEWDAITGEQWLTPYFVLSMHNFTDLGVWEFDEAGTLNAVYAYLRSLGVRWYAPGEIGEVVPKLATISLPAVNETVRPDFAVRDFKIYYTHAGLGDLAPWKLRMGTSPGAKYIGTTQPGHGMKFVMGRPEFKKAHPEFFALRADGQRETDHRGDGKPCLSSEGLFQQHVKYVRAMFDHYGERVVSIDLPDGFGSRPCLCEACKAQVSPDRGEDGRLSNYVWGYINRVAQEVYKTHPNRIVTGLAYSNYQLPPDNIEQMSPNLGVIECRWRSNLTEEARAFFAKLREDWLKKLPSQEYFVWDYYLHSRTDSAGIPAYFPHLIAQDLRDLRGKSKGDTIEVFNTVDAKEKGYTAFAVNHLNLYVTSRLWWNADEDVDKLLEEYYTLFYGPAREQMKAFVTFCEANWRDMRKNAEKISQALTLLESARAAAGTDSIYAQRIEKISEFVEPLKNLYKQLAKNTQDLPDYRVLRVKDVTERKMSQKPLDGNLDKDYWAPVRVAALKTVAGGRNMPSTSFQILSEGNTLYVGIRCQESDMANLNIPTEKSGDPKILEGDFVSFIYETSSHSYYELVVNPAGAVLEFDHGEKGYPGWSSGAKVAVHRGDGFWSVEARIPIVGEGARLINPEQGIDGNPPRSVYPWYFNIARQRVRGGDIAQSVFFPGETPGIRDPKNMAKLQGKK